ncbi:HutD family protein [Streptomyces sp. NPDC102451]|uniref:HutD/Ves family protein n=1 Tax=Streptomyces sp. NPDC102451 TaxID=3366177 RepID=UPI003809F3CC
MTPQILRAEDRAPTPWKNGGGMTTEVTTHPPGAGNEDFEWRVSVADVARDGSFSSFPGVDRIITVVDGPGMTLTLDGTKPTMGEPFEPFAFSGEAVTECQLMGEPVVAFNVMVRRAHTAARVGMFRSGTTVRPAPGSQVLAVVLSGSAVLRRDSVRLDRFDAVLLSDEDAEGFDVAGVLAIVHLTAVPGR